jgi:ubiquinone biosynthesis protein
MGGEGMYFHADPHPSNVLLLPHGRLAMLDFGLLGHFEQRELKMTRDLFLSIYTKNVEESIRLGLAMAGVPYEIHAEKVRKDVRAYVEQAHHEGLGYWFMEFIRLFMRHRLPLPYQLVLYGRLHIIMDGACQFALPGETTLDLLGDELAWGLRRQIIQNIRSVNPAVVLYILSEKMKESPEKIANLIDKYFDDPLQAVRDFRMAVRA